MQMHLCVFYIYIVRSRYWDAMYWSLTTMTTIGYGDRGPKTESEILYTLFAEVFGLGFFALLLTQITRTNDLIGVAGLRAKETKDGILQFLAARRISGELTQEVVRFLSFRNNSLSGNSLDDVAEMAILSAGVRGKIQTAVYVPVLKRISMFGWNPDDELEQRNVKEFFERIDETGDGNLDRTEVGHLFKALGIELTAEQFDLCYSELDRDHEGSVDLNEFSYWWFKTKYGVPRPSSGIKAPDAFLTALAVRLTSTFSLATHFLIQI